MDNKIVRLEVVEAQGLAGEGGTGALPSAAACLESGGASENFGVGEQGELGVRQGEAAGQGAEEHRQAARRIGFRPRQLAQSRGFALVGADDAHGPTVRLPLSDLSEEVTTPLLMKHDVTRGEIAERMISAEDFHLPVVGQHRTGVQARVGPGFAVLDGEKQSVRGQVVAHGGIVRPAAVTERELAGSEGFHRALRIGIVGTDGFDFVAEKFKADGQRGLPRVDIDDAAAHGVMTTLRRGGNALESGLLQLGNQIGERQALSVLQGEDVSGEFFPRGRGVTQPFGRDDNERRLVGVEFAQSGETRGGQFRVGTAHACGGQLEIGEEQGAFIPEEQIVVELLLAFDIRADHADRTLQIRRQPGGKKGLGRHGGSAGDSGRALADGREP